MRPPLARPALAALTIFALGAPAPGAPPPPEQDLAALARRTFETDASPDARLAANRVLFALGQPPEGGLALVRETLAKAPRLGDRFDDALRSLAESLDPARLDELFAYLEAAPAGRPRARAYAVARAADPSRADRVLLAVLNDPARETEPELAEAVLARAGEVPVPLLGAVYRRQCGAYKQGEPLHRALKGRAAALAQVMALDLSRHPDPARRAGAARDLAAFDSPETRARLVKMMLEETDREARLNAGASLRRLDPPAFAGVAAPLMQAGAVGPGVRFEWLAALGELRIQMFEPLLVAALDDSEMLVRAGAARGLAALGSSAAWPRLEALLASPDTRRFLKAELIQGLAETPLPAARRALAKVLDAHPDAELGRLAGESLAALSGADAEVWLYPRLDRPYRFTTRRLVAGALAPRPFAAHALAARMAVENDELMRVEVAQALGKRGGRIRLEALERALDDPAISVRAAALQALAKIKGGADRVAHRVEDLLATAEGYDLRHAATRALVEIRGPRAAALMAKYGRQESVPSLRQILLRGLARHAPADYPTWAAVLGDEFKADLRRLAAQMLAPAASEYEPALRRAVLRDADGKVRRQALLALAGLS